MACCYAKQKGVDVSVFALSPMLAYELMPTSDQDLIDLDAELSNLYE